MTTPTELITPQFIPTSQSQLFVAGEVSAVSSISINNTSSTTDATFNAWLIPEGETVTGSYQVITSMRVRPGETNQAPELRGSILNSGSSLYFSASVADTLVVHASGVEFD